MSSPPQFSTLPNVQIPLDIIQVILTHLYLGADFRSLRACSLTSHAIHGFAVQLLFCDILVGHPRVLQKLTSLLRDAPNIPSLIQGLTLRDYPDGSWIASSDSVPPLLQKVDRLRRFTLCTSDPFTGVQYGRLTPEVAQSIFDLTRRPSMQNVRIDFADFFDCHGIFLPGELYGRLDSLFIGAVNQAVSSEPNMSLAQVALRTLRVTFPDRLRHSSSFNTFLQSVISESAIYSFGHLQKLAFVSSKAHSWTPGRGLREINAMNQIIGRAADTLKILMIHPSPNYLHYSPIKSQDFLILNYLPQLHTVHLVLYCDGSPHGHDMRMFTWAADLFHHSFLPQLAIVHVSVDIQVYATTLQFPSRTGWDVLDAGIHQALWSSSTARRPHTVVVEVMFGPWENIDKGLFLRNVRKEMYRLDGEGVLKLSWRSTYSSSVQVPNPETLTLGGLGIITTRLLPFNAHAMHLDCAAKVWEEFA
ncbi:hypothetical protein DL96DRAFT_1111009 [Flagelloscypha sp. PMI_526]|nr:hypothetical protein DL96DRAFT_1111009 [Flagelloscypha sp. PMI_526]